MTIVMCRPVHEVLQKLTSLQSSGPPGASLDDIDELHVRLDEGLERTMDLEAAVAELLEIKADKAALAKLGQVVRDLWKAVQELQGPEGTPGPEWIICTWHIHLVGQFECREKPNIPTRVSSFEEP
jgi:hypothetical protein